MDEIERNRERLAELCRRWKVRELALFGSGARGALRPDSDLDFLVSFSPAAQWDLIDVLHMQDELEALFGRKVDLVELEALQESDNWIVRREVFGTAERIYASAA